MATTSDIKAGGAYVELTADNAKLLAGLAKAETRIKFFGRAVSAAFAGRTLRRISEEILEVQKQLADGSLEAGQGTAAFAEGIVKGIPIVGDFYNGIKNIVMALDGTATAAVEAQMAMDAMNKSVAEMRKAEQNSRAMEDLTKSVKEYGQELRDALAIENATNDAERERIQLYIEYRQAMDKLADEEQKALEMPLTGSSTDQKRRSDALSEILRRRSEARDLYLQRTANLQKRQDATAAEEAASIAEEMDSLGREKVRLDQEHFDFVRSLDQRAHDLRIEAIEDEDARALEKINVRYAREREEILRNGRTQTEQAAELAASERARQQEVANFEAQQARQRAASLQSLDDQLAEARDAADASLTDQDRRLRAIDRQEAAALAGAVVGGAVPLDMADRIRQLADLQRAAVGAAEPVTRSSGAFSGAMLQSLQGANISAAEETAENTAALLKSSNEMVRELRKKGVYFL